FPVFAAPGLVAWPSYHSFTLIPSIGSIRAGACHEISLGRSDRFIAISGRRSKDMQRTRFYPNKRAGGSVRPGFRLGALHLNWWNRKTKIGKITEVNKELDRNIDEIIAESNDQIMRFEARFPQELAQFKKELFERLDVCIDLLETIRSNWNVSTTSIES